MTRSELADYINNILPNDAQPISGGKMTIANNLYDKINKFGELTFGSNNEASVFKAMKILANENDNVRKILTKNSTEIGIKINQQMLDHIDDPWFNSILLYRPDMLISNTDKVYTNELEIVCGGISFPALLQRYLYGEFHLLDALFNKMNQYKIKFGLDGCLAIIGDRYGLRQIKFTRWIEKYYSYIKIASIDDLIFKSDGIYIKNNKIAVAQLFIKAHKLNDAQNNASIKLLNYWLERKIFVFSPPSLLMDNKSIMYFLKSHEYRTRLKEILGEDRYNSISSYIPNTYLFTDSAVTSEANLEYCQKLITKPWEYGKFIFKFATTWGSNNILISPDSSISFCHWLNDINKMINDAKYYGNIIIQELIPVKQIEVPECQIVGNTKFTPFFIHDEFEKTCEHICTIVNITPNSLMAHNDSASKFALIEPDKKT